MVLLDPRIHCRARWPPLQSTVGRHQKLKNVLEDELCTLLAELERLVLQVGVAREVIKIPYHYRQEISMPVC